MLPLPQAPQVCLPASVLAAAASAERAWPLRKEPRLGGGPRLELSELSLR